MKNAYKMIMEADELIDSLEWHLDNLKKEIDYVRDQLCTAKKHGLGHNLLATELIKKLEQHLVGLEAVAKQGQKHIKQASPDNYKFDIAQQARGQFDNYLFNRDITEEPFREYARKHDPPPLWKECEIMHPWCRDEWHKLEKLPPH